MPLTAKEIIDSVGGLVSLPEACLKINALLDDPETTADDLGRVISHDPALTVRMLHIANSAFYGLSAKVDNVSKAVRVIGMQKIRDLVLASSAIKAFDGLPNDLVTLENFWVHSIYCGLIAKGLAAKHRQLSIETLFTAGMLHDIGQLVIFNKLPEQSRKILTMGIDDPGEPELYSLERDLIGFDHCEVGGELARKWKLPELLQECIKFHHEPDRAQAFPLEVAIVYVANQLAVMAEINSSSLDDTHEILPSAIETIGVSPEDFIPIIEEAKSQFIDMKSALLSN